MATTIRQIAEQSCVSPALVSRVLNNKPGMWASAETRQRIVETARLMNYQPSASARALVTGRTMQIAISSADESWHDGRSGRLLEVCGLIDAAALNRYRVLVLPSPASHADRQQFEMLLHSKICDGLCLYAEQADAQLYAWLQEHSIPFVIIGRHSEADLPYVDHDNYDYAFSSVRWLQERGHRRIVWSAPNDETGDDPHVKELHRGYLAAMKSLCGDKNPRRLDVKAHKAGEIVQLIGTPDAPTAAIVRGLASTLQWKIALQLQRVRLPEAFTLLAHLDPTELAFLKQGELTEGIACHVHDPREVGRQAAQSLIRWIKDGACDLQPVLVTPHAPGWCESN